MSSSTTPGLTQPPTAELPPVSGGSKRTMTQKQPRKKKTKVDSANACTKEDAPSPSHLLLSYMRQQNRPYNVQLIFDNLKRAIKKPELERLLDKLVAEDYLISKDLGKTRVFMYSQRQFVLSEANREAISTGIQEFIKQKTAERQRREEARVRSGMLEGLQAKVVSAEMQRKVRLQQQRSGEPVSAAAAAAAETLHAKLHAAWALQKRRCLQLIQLLAERTQTDEKQLQSELGLERDEDYIPADAYKYYK
ncbi:homologous-pairing protein 2 homolog [Cyclospora cayetanensis]|uniref:Homologous-pairing protein 2 homolog n=1 Tax=Cyclospora cayetanensis TaxID=88456 RepID=A0A6P6RU16_9EIME|nr:homologous-pairing protein 2 homolog [Cyclospora cayetanensis]